MPAALGNLKTAVLLLPSFPPISQHSHAWPSRFQHHQLQPARDFRAYLDNSFLPPLLPFKYLWDASFISLLKIHLFHEDFSTMTRSYRHSLRMCHLKNCLCPCSFLPHILIYQYLNCKFLMTESSLCIQCYVYWWCSNNISETLHGWFWIVCSSQATMSLCHPEVPPTLLILSNICTLAGFVIKILIQCTLKLFYGLDQRNNHT